MVAHTAGPWKAGIATGIQDPSGVYRAMIFFGAKLPVGSIIVREDVAEAKANAALVAAAPDLLESLQRLIKDIEGWPIIHTDGDYLHGGMLLQARAAIAKATQ